MGVEMCTLPLIEVRAVDALPVVSIRVSIDTSDSQTRFLNSTTHERDDNDSKTTMKNKVITSRHFNPNKIKLIVERNHLSDQRIQNNIEFYSLHDRNENHKIVPPNKPCSWKENRSPSSCLVYKII